MKSSILCVAAFLTVLSAGVPRVDGQTIAANNTGGNGGTTPGIQNIFIDRCEQFQIDKSQLFINDSKNCTQLWYLFLNAFAYKDPCNVTVDSYAPFMAAANHTSVINNQAMFWAFVYPLVYNYTASQGGRYMTILDLLSGYCLNGLVWCWSLANQTLNYQTCPNYTSCPNQTEAYRSFWKGNSQTYAHLANGTVFAMLNGSKSTGAYTNMSLFDIIEVPSLNSTNVKLMQIYLVHDLDRQISEYCNNGTMLTLENELTNKGIAFNCTSDIPGLKALQCQLNPNLARFCNSTSSSSSPSATTFTLISSLVVGLRLFFY